MTRRSARSRTARPISTPTSRSRRSSSCASGATSVGSTSSPRPTPKLDVTASFTTQKHGGELPWGASFGFSNDVEVPLPYESRANDFTIGTEWTNTKNMLRVAYSGSWFDNLADPLVWDSPLRLDDISARPDADACPSGRRTRRRRSASAATASWRTGRRSPASSPTACGATTSRCSRSPSIRH